MTSSALQKRKPGRPSVPDDVRLQSARRTEFLRNAIRNDPAWNVRRLADALGLRREALSHVLHDRVICTEALFRQAASKMRLDADEVEGQQVLPVAPNDLTRTLTAVLSHSGLAQLPLEAKTEIAVQLAQRIHAEGLSAASMSEQELSHHLIAELARRYTTEKKDS